MTKSIATTLNLPDVEATEGLGRAIASSLPNDTAGWTLLLDGDLGAGKSTLARALLRALGHAGPVPSPTYTLVEPYDIGGRNVYHIDLYRVGSEDELRYLGWHDLEAGMRLVEWPDRAPSLVHSADISIRLDYVGDGRTAVLTGLSPRGCGWLESALPMLALADAFTD